MQATQTCSCRCSVGSVGNGQLPCRDARRVQRNGTSLVSHSSSSRVASCGPAAQCLAPSPVISSRSHAWLIARQTRGSSWMSRVMEHGCIAPPTKPSPSSSSPGCAFCKIAVLWYFAVGVVCHPFLCGFLVAARAVTRSWYQRSNSHLVRLRDCPSGANA